MTKRDLTGYSRKWLSPFTDDHDYHRIISSTHVRVLFFFRMSRPMLTSPHIDLYLRISSTKSSPIRSLASPRNHWSWTLSISMSLACHRRKSDSPSSAQASTPWGGKVASVCNSEGRCIPLSLDVDLFLHTHSVFSAVLHPWPSHWPNNVHSHIPHIHISHKAMTFFAFLAAVNWQACTMYFYHFSLLALHNNLESDVFLLISKKMTLASAIQMVWTFRVDGTVLVLKLMLPGRVFHHDVARSGHWRKILKTTDRCL